MYDPTNDITNSRLCKSPFLNWRFSFFFVSIIIVFGLGIYYYFFDQNISYHVSAIFGFIACIYGCYHFQTLLNLRLGINNYSKLNRDFFIENKKLQIQVNSLSAAQNELNDTHQKLKHINTINRENLQKFKFIQENMRQINNDINDGMDEALQKAMVIDAKWRKLLIGKERAILAKLFDRNEHKIDKTQGMTENDFNEFITMLPNAYIERFQRLGTFRKLAAGKSYIDFKDFALCMDVFAEMSVENCDIDFEITKTKTNIVSEPLAPLSSEPEPSFIRHILITKKSAPGTIFSFKDINPDDSD